MVMKSYSSARLQPQISKWPRSQKPKSIAEQTPDFVHKQLTRDYLSDITTSNPIRFGSGWFQRNNHRLQITKRFLAQHIHSISSPLMFPSEYQRGDRNEERSTEQSQGMTWEPLHMVTLLEIHPSWSFSNCNREKYLEKVKWLNTTETHNFSSRNRFPCAFS